MIDSLFILGDDRQIIIEKHWKGVINRSTLEPFYVALKNCVSSVDVPPILESGDSVLVIMKEGTLFFIAVVKSEASPMLAMEFIAKLNSLLRAYIGVVNETKLRSNFSMVYQLLDEMADYGVPVITEPSVMSSLIQIPSILNKVSNFVIKAAGLGDDSTWLPGSSNNTVTWRRPDIKYSRNEIRFFVIERINATITPYAVKTCVGHSIIPIMFIVFATYFDHLVLLLIYSKGKSVDVSATGILRVQSRLSGNPEIAATLNGVDNIQGIFLNKIVNRSRFDSSRTLEFVPLDGVFDIMRYKVARVKDFTPAFYCRPSLTWVKGDSSYWGQLEVMLGSRPNRKLEGNPVIASDIVVTLTLPAETSGANITASVGRVLFNQEEKTIRWVVGSLRKEDNPSLKGPVYLQSGAPVPKSSMVAGLQFIQLDATVSGLTVSKATAQRVGSDYGMISGVQSQVEAGYYDIQM